MSEMRKAKALSADAVLAMIDADDGWLTAADRRTIGAGQSLARRLRRELCVLAWPDLEQEELARAGAGRIVQLALPHKVEERSAMSLALKVLDAGRAGRVVLAPDGTGRAADALRRFAASENCPILPNVIAFDGDDTVIQIIQDQYSAPIRGALLLNPFHFGPGKAVETYAAACLTATTDTTAVCRTDETRLPVTDLPLAKADIIISAGMGVKDWDTFHALAGAIGAAVGGTRAICDTGALPRACQIGASGSAVSPNCYLAMGISGAPHHLQGLAQCNHVIAVNLDPNAAMVARANLAVIADVQEIMPALLAALEGT